MKTKYLGKMACISAVAFLCCGQSGAWEHHSLLAGPVVASWPEVASRAPIVAVPLEEFLLAMEPILETVLAEEESWAREHMDSYAPLPDELAFKATGNAADIRRRFFDAIRVNPGSKAALYLSELTADPEAPRTGLDPSAITVMPDAGELKQFRFEELAPGAAVSPGDVLVTASHEPDYGLDIGLFLDNGTEYGARYGLGEQPFGDPDLIYGSQAPFHMGFYHESWLVYLFAGYLKATYPEYRIHLYKTLSEAAFEQGQDYWGWRFMGWGLHYVADLAMPYHTTVLPGYSTFRMLLINLLSILGCPRYVDEALQLVSNRHMALERFQGIMFERLTRAGDWSNALLQVLQAPGSVPAYNDDMPREEMARQSHDLSREMNKVLTKFMPDRFVNDPDVELAEQPDLDQIVELVAGGECACGVERLNDLLREALSIFSVYGRSYIAALLPE